MTTLASPPIPLRPYPGITAAFGDLVEAVANGVREQSQDTVAQWVEREMHAATAVEIETMVEAACDQVVGSSSESERPAILRRIDEIRSDISRIMILNESRVRETSDDIADGIIAVTSIVNPALGDHLDATGILSGRIAYAMGLNAQIIKTCVVAGRLHDIGKMAIPINVLEKPGKLTPEEYELVKRHADAGDQMLTGIPGLQQYAKIVRAHHERMDGSGYPDGLVGEEIPLESRIIAVADVFHAIISERSYREPRDPREALMILDEGRVTKFDEHAVDTILALFGIRRIIAAA